MKTIYVNEKPELVEDYPLEFLNVIFNAKSASASGVLKRSIATVERFASEIQLRRVVEQHNFQLFKTSKYYIIICDPDAKLIRLVPGRPEATPLRENDND